MNPVRLNPGHYAMGAGRVPSCGGSAARDYWLRCVRLDHGIAIRRPQPGSHRSGPAQGPLPFVSLGRIRDFDTVHRRTKPVPPRDKRKSGTVGARLRRTVRVGRVAAMTHRTAALAFARDPLGRVVALSSLLRAAFLFASYSAISIQGSGRLGLQWTDDQARRESRNPYRHEKAEGDSNPAFVLPGRFASRVVER